MGRKPHNLEAPEYVSGNKRIKLLDKCRFSTFERHERYLDQWKQHFTDKKMKWAVGKVKRGYALYVEHRCL
jgi:hypothetical protein